MRKGQFQSQSTGLRRALLAGTSAGAIVLAMGVALLPAPSIAQEIGDSAAQGAGTPSDPTILTGGAPITNLVPGGTNGVIDTNGGANNPASITLGVGATIWVHDSNEDVDAETATVQGDFIIADNVGFALVGFAVSDNPGGAPTKSGDAVLTINGDLRGADDNPIGGTLFIGVETGVDQDKSAFNVLGSTNMENLLLFGTGAGPDSDGGNLAARFGDNQSDTVRVDSFGVSGGAGEQDESSGGDVNVTIQADTDIEFLSLSGGSGGDAAGQDSGGLGGDARLTITDEDGADFGDITVQGGEGGNVGSVSGGNGGIAILTVKGDLTATNIAITGGEDGEGGGPGQGGRGASAQLLAGGDISAKSITLDDNGRNAVLLLDGEDAQSVYADISAESGGDGTVQTANTTGVTFNGNIGGGDEGYRHVGVVRVGEDNIVTFNGYVWTGTFEITNGKGNDDAVPLLTFNAGLPGYGKQPAQVTIIDEVTLKLDDANIVLGANVGVGDTVFDNTRSNLDVENVSENGVVISLSSNIGDGDVIFIDNSGTIDTQGNGSSEFARFAVNQNALTMFELSLDDGQSEDSQLVINAKRRSFGDMADILGVTEEQAAALQSMVDASNAAFEEEGNEEEDEALVDAISAALNDTDGAGGAFSQQAANAAKSLTTQEDTLGGASETAFVFSNQIMKQVFDQLQSRRDGANGGGFAGGDPVYRADAADAAWVNPFGGFATADGDGLRAGYDAAYGGVAFGIDGGDDDFTFGLLGAYTYSELDGDGIGGAQLTANSYQIGTYGAYNGDAFHVDGFASFGWSYNDLSRTVALAGPVAGVAKADFSATQFSAGIGAGVPFAIGQNTFLTPQASLAYFSYGADGYTETGTAAIATGLQTVETERVNQVTGTLAARLHGTYQTGGGTTVAPEATVGLVFDMLDDDAVATARFAGGGSAFQVTGTDTDDIGALVGVGVTFDNADWSASFNYDGDIRGNFQNHTGSAEFRWKF